MSPRTSDLLHRFFAAAGARARTLGALPALAAMALVLLGSLPLSARSSGSRQTRIASPGSTRLSTPTMELRSLKPSDLIAQQDIDRSPRGYQLSVPGVGNVYVKALKASRSGKTCRVHEPSLIRALTANPLVSGQPKWLQLTIYDCPWGGTCCLGPLGGGCYILVSK